MFGSTLNLNAIYILNVASTGDDLAAESCTFLTMHPDKYLQPGNSNMDDKREGHLTKFIGAGGNATGIRLTI